MVRAAPGVSDLAVHRRRRARDFQQPGLDAALFEQRRNRRGVPADALGIARQVRQGEQ